MFSAISAVTKWAPALFAWMGIDLSSERGQDLIEYTALGGLIAAALVGAVALLGGDITSFFGSLGDCIDGDASTPCTLGF